MDNLMLFYPLIVLLFFIFFDVRNRKKRPAPPPQQPVIGRRSSLMIGRRSCRRKGRGAAMKVRTKKLYRGMWSFQKTGRPKSSLRRKIPVRNLHRQQKLLFRNPCINVLSRRSPSLPLKAFAAAGQ